jgi:hypothetical protein
MNATVQLNSTVVVVVDSLSLFISSLANIQSRIGYYFLFIFPFSGVVLNAFSLLIFSRASLNKTNMGFLYMWQTSFDIVLILVYIFETRSTTLFGQYIGSHAEVLCNSVRWLRRVTLHASSWMGVYITFDRYAFVCQPTRLAIMRNKWCASLTIVCMLLVLVAINTPNYFATLVTTIQVVNSTTPIGGGGVGDDNVNNQTVMNITTITTQIITRTCRVSSFHSTLTNMISSVMRTWWPILMMVIFDLLIVRRLNANKLKLTANNKPKTKSLQRKESHYTKNVILLNLLFFAFNGPLAVFYLMDTIHDYTLNQSNHRLYLAIFNFFYSMSVNLSYMYQSISFFIYFAFNSLYRNELLIILRLRSAQVMPTDLNSTTMNPSAKAIQLPQQTETNGNMRQFKE